MGIIFHNYRVRWVGTCHHKHAIVKACWVCHWPNPSTRGSSQCQTQYLGLTDGVKPNHNLGMALARPRHHLGLAPTKPSSWI
jgi:hypothetical protein